MIWAEWKPWDGHWSVWLTAVEFQKTPSSLGYKAIQDIIPSFPWTKSPHIVGRNSLGHNHKSQCLLSNTITRKTGWRKGYARQCRHPANAFKVGQRKFRRKFELIAVQGHQSHRFWCQLKTHNATSYKSLIVTLVVSRTVFRDIDKSLLVTRSAQFYCSSRGS